MKGVRFYEEFTHKRKGQSSGNCVALFYENGFRVEKRPGQESVQLGDAVAAVQFHSNSPVCSTEVARTYLSEDCKRVSEKRAREIHPQLFAYLDADDKPAKRARKQKRT